MAGEAAADGRVHEKVEPLLDLRLRKPACLEEPLRMPVAATPDGVAIDDQASHLRQPLDALQGCGGVVGQAPVEDEVEHLQVRLAGDLRARHDLFGLTRSYEASPITAVEERFVAELVAEAVRRPSICDDRREHAAQP